MLTIFNEMQQCWLMCNEHRMRDSSSSYGRCCGKSSCPWKYPLFGGPQSQALEQDGYFPSYILPGAGVETGCQRRYQKDVHKSTWVSKAQGKLQNALPPP